MRAYVAESGAKLKQLHALDPRKELLSRLVDEAGLMTYRAKQAAP